MSLTDEIRFPNDRLVFHPLRTALFFFRRSSYSVKTSKVKRRERDDIENTLEMLTKTVKATVEAGVGGWFGERSSEGGNSHT